MPVDDLVSSIQMLQSEDALRCRLDAQQWKTMEPYLTRHELKPGEALIRQGEQDRTLYFLERGTLQVYVSGGAPGAGKVALLQAGSIVGEGGFFAAGPRSANVESLAASVVWAMRLTRFEELAHRQPLVALELCRGIAAVMAMRMRQNLQRQAPVVS